MTNHEFNEATNKVWRHKCRSIVMPCVGRSHQCAACLALLSLGGATSFALLLEDLGSLHPLQALDTHLHRGAVMRLLSPTVLQRYFKVKDNKLYDRMHPAMAGL